MSGENQVAEIIQLNPNRRSSRLQAVQSLYIKVPHPAAPRNDAQSLHQIWADQSAIEAIFKTLAEGSKRVFLHCEQFEASPAFIYGSAVIEKIENHGERFLITFGDIVAHRSAPPVLRNAGPVYFAGAASGESDGGGDDGPGASRAIA